MDIRELLDQLYSEVDINKRRYIPDKLAKLGDWSSTEPLGELILDISQPLIMRNEATESLGKQGDPRAVAFLQGVLDDSDPDIRRTAIWSLGQIGIPETLNLIFRKQNDSHIAVRRWVAKSAGRIRSPDVLSRLKEFYLSISSDEDEHVVADIIRAVTSQIDQANRSQLLFWSEEMYKILQTDSKSYVKQAGIVLLNCCFDRDVLPNSELLHSIYHDISKSDVLVLPHLLQSLGHLQEVEYLKTLPNPEAIIALGIAQASDHLRNLLNKDGISTGKICNILQAFTFIKANLDVSTYVNHENIDVRLAALTLHALHSKPIKLLHDQYSTGIGRYKVLELYRYYGDESLDILEMTAFDKDKVVRQTTVDLLISNEMLGTSNNLDLIKKVLIQVTQTDTIWHIRRDARIGIEQIDRKLSNLEKKND